VKNAVLKLAEAPLQGWRRFSQFLFLFLLNPVVHRFIPGLSEPMMGVCVPVMNCWSCPAAAFACPVGAVGQLMARGVFPFLTLGILILTGSLLGRLVCGWVCPFGLLQDLMFKIPTKHKYRTPHPLRWIKYGLLVVMVVAVPILFGVEGGMGEPGGYFYCKWCPAGTLEASIPVNVQMVIEGRKGFGEMVLGYMASVKFWIAVLFLASFVFLYRPFCKIACPIGAFLGLFNKVDFLDFGKNRGDCRSCGQCADVCPVIPDVVVMDNSPECIRCYRCDDPRCRKSFEARVNEAECTGCMLCVKACPNDALEGERKSPPRMKDPGACTGCLRCQEKCPHDALEIVEKENG